MPLATSQQPPASAARPVNASIAWSMPSRWTFSVPPIRAFVARHLAAAGANASDNPLAARRSPFIIDPFAGRSSFATLSNDLAWPDGQDAADWCRSLLPSHAGRADAIIFDPPYSPRQISECYRSVGRPCGMADTQNGSLYRRVREPLAQLLKPGGLAISFGWQSGGFGRAWPTIEMLLVQHGGGHNDTICVAQRKPEV